MKILISFRSTSLTRCKDGSLNNPFTRSNVCWLKVKVKVTLVQALRLCTGRTVHRGSTGIALLEGKVHPCTGTEALYRPPGPYGE
jgi:hypothetical protein